MRAAPIGLLFFNKPEQLVQAAHDQSRITHQDKRCSAGSILIAGAVALALQSLSIDADKFLYQLSEWAKMVEESVAFAVLTLNEVVSLSPEKAVAFISRAGVDSNYLDEWQGISPFVTSSVLWSLYSFLKTPENYWETICTAIAVGGDVDTTAAMAGAISGAYLGLEGIPLHLADCLTDQGSWGFVELVELAHKSYNLKIQQ